jgi:hypothetical protein
MFVKTKEMWKKGMAAGCLLITESVLAIEKVKLKGNDVEVKDNDIVSMIIEIAAVIVGLIFGILCIRAVLETISACWQKYGEYRVGQATLSDLMWPLVTGGGMAIMTMGLAYYVVTNFTSFI